MPDRFCIRTYTTQQEVDDIYDCWPHLFSTKLHHGGVFTRFPNVEYVDGKSTYIDLLDPDWLSVHELDRILGKLGYDQKMVRYYHYRVPNQGLDFGLRALGSDSGVMGFFKYTTNHKLMNVYTEFVETNVHSYFYSPSKVVIKEVRGDLNRDFRLNIDVGVENNGNEYVDDIGDEAVVNDRLDSGSDSDTNETSVRKNMLRFVRKVNENTAQFHLGQVFGTKMEAKLLVRQHSVETRRELRNVKDDGDRLRVQCKGDLPNFTVDADGVHSQPVDKGGKGKGKAVEGVGKGKAVKSKSKAGSSGKDKGKLKQNPKGQHVQPNTKGNLKVGGGSKVGDKNVGDKNVGGRGHKSNPEKQECPWTLLISKEPHSDSWVVRTFIDKHTCLQSRNVYHCTSTFLGNQLMEQIEENPSIPVKAVQEQYQRRYEVSISRMKAFRARAKALKKLNGDYESQFTILRDYCGELMKTNPGTTIHIEVETPTDPDSNIRKFQRIYVCLGPLKQGFKAIGRELLGLDGAFIKGPFPGQVLSAVGIDPNNGIYPLAYAIVEAENTSSWTWFLKCIATDLDLNRFSNFTFVSDRQKGIIPALEEVFPYAEHRFCLRHIHENMKLRFRGKAYRDFLWKMATSSTVEYFEQNMQELKKFNTDAQLWVSEIPPKHWSKSHFSGRALSDVVLNNMCEVFNAKIVDGRDKPIITMLEFIREYLMRRIVNVLRAIDGWDKLLTPYAHKTFEVIKQRASKCTVQWNGADHIQVSGPSGVQFVVDFRRRICACRKWEITGMPCKHVVAAIWNKAMFGQGTEMPETYINPIYTLDRWKKVYNFKVFPINGRSMWPKSQVPSIITSPKYHKPIGRPKKARKKSTFELEEVTKGGKLSKKGTPKACQKCKKVGHNSRTCKGQQPT